jgi:hypothetical protein
VTEYWRKVHNEEFNFCNFNKIMFGKCNEGRWRSLLYRIHGRKEMPT